MELSIATLGDVLAKFLDRLIEPRDKVGKSLEQGPGGDRFDVRGDVDACSDEHRLPVGWIDHEARMPAGERCLAKQLEGERSPQLILVEVPTTLLLSARPM